MNVLNMVLSELKPMILTVRFDADSQEYFNKQRELFFPVERNFLKAHLTMFHQLPDKPSTRDYFEKDVQKPFDIEVIGLMSLGNGVAYKLNGAELGVLHNRFKLHFAGVLIPQDRQPFRPHVSVQNKVSPEQAKALLADLHQGFKPFKISALGLDLWVYNNGPWIHDTFYKFQ